MYYAYVTTIKELRKHNNADRLQVATIFGNNVIVDLSYKVGMSVIYFPIDGQLSEEFAKDNNLLRVKDENGNNIGGYLDPVKRNITAINLRGEKSEGLVLPIKVLDKYCDSSKLMDGENISILNGHEICCKYVPQKRPRQNGNKKNDSKSINKKELRQKISYPYFAEHIDTAQLAYNQAAFKEGDIIYLTRKLHGTSARISNAVEITTKKRPHWIKKLFHVKNKITKKYQIVSGTRHQTLRSYDNGFYGSNQFRQKYNDMFIGKLPKGMTVYGEIVGWVNESTPIMPRCNNSKVKDKEFSKMYGKETVFTYGCMPGESDFYVYRITMSNEDGVTVELPTEETILWCERLGVKYVPLLEKFLYTTWEDLNERCQKYLDVPEPLSNGSHVTEGVVVRIDNRSRFTAYKTKSWYFKVLSGIAVDSLTDEELSNMSEDLISEM